MSQVRSLMRQTWKRLSEYDLRQVEKDFKAELAKRLDKKYSFDPERRRAEVNAFFAYCGMPYRE